MSRWNVAGTRAKTARTPTVLQMEAVECGAASLAMVLAYYGRWVPLEQLREECGVARDGTNAGNILKAARRHGLIAKGFRKEVGQLHDIRAPAILHWNFNHFVVFEGIRRGRYLINDPSQGRRVLSREEVDEAFTGVLLAFEQGTDFARQGTPSRLLPMLSARLSGARDGLAMVLLASLLLAIPGLVIPAFLKVLVDDIFGRQAQSWLAPLLIAMGLTAIIRGGLTFVQQFYLARLEAKLAAVASSRYFERLLRLPLAFFLQRQPGDLMNRVEAGERMARLLSGDLATSAFNLISVIFFSLAMLLYDPVLAGLAIGLSAANGVGVWFNATRAEEDSAAVASAAGKLQGATVGTLSAIETIKANGEEDDAFAVWSGYQANALKTIQRQMAASQVVQVIPKLLSGLTTSLVLILGAFRVMEGAMTVGDLVAFQTLLGSYAAPIARLTGLSTQVQAARADLSKLQDAFRYPMPKPSIFVHPTGTPLARMTIENVSFGYAPLSAPILDDFSLELQPGRRVALVGGSGSGKSTVGRLAAGLTVPWTGEIRIEGHPLAALDPATKARALAYVDQNAFLFEGTVRENLSLWDDTLPDEALMDALRDAELLSEVTARGGLEARVLEGGTNFSGGQRQRLEIARALTRNSRILILDEATSALDALTEQLVDVNLRRRGCSCLIIAHRLSTIRDCEEILVLERGRVIERGNHDHLMTLEGAYANLVRSQ